MLFQSQFPLEFENSHIREESLLDKVFSYFLGESEILWIRFKVLAIYNANEEIGYKTGKMK